MTARSDDAAQMKKPELRRRLVALGLVDASDPATYRLERSELLALFPAGYDFSAPEDAPPPTRPVASSEPVLYRAGDPEELNADGLRALLTERGHHNLKQMSRKELLELLKDDEVVSRSTVRRLKIMTEGQGDG